MAHCWMRDELCENDLCYHWISWVECGNCTLRCRDPLNDVEIALAMGISKQRVGQIKKSALEKMKRRLTHELQSGGEGDGIERESCFPRDEGTPDPYDTYYNPSITSIRVDY